MDNRVTTFNCYALGNVTGNAENNNKVHIGGFAGQAGGIHYNCYAKGDVISLKTTTDVGAISGRSAGIAADLNCYYNSEAVVKQGNTVYSPAKAVGVNANNSALIKSVVGKTAAELASEDFASLLNENLSSENLAVADAEFAAFLEGVNSRGFAEVNYYTGNELLGWVLDNGVATFGEKDEAYAESITLGGSYKTDYKVGETLDVTGLVITVNLSDKTNYKVNATADMVSGFDSTEAGKKILVVSYEGLNTVYIINVEDDKPSIILPIERVYNITILDSEGGEVVSNRERSFAGRVFRLEAVADEGYELVALIVRDSDGNMISGEDGICVMPESDVTVI